METKKGQRMRNGAGERAMYMTNVRSVIGRFSLMTAAVALVVALAALAALAQLRERAELSSRGLPRGRSPSLPKDTVFRGL